MLRLLTFGGLSLVDDGAPVTGAASQRSRLALLAVLATAGQAGVSRDKLLACLWPESDDERARHALKQAVYALRRDIGNENAIAGTATLTLDPSIVTSDVREFEDALARGDDASAVGVYNGPFLDGVFVRGAAEFDQWAATERTRLERSCMEAIGRLAKDAESKGDFAAAVQWWRKGAAAEPLSGRVALSLMRALAESGDVSAAIQHSRVHEALVRAELDTAPDDAVVAFVDVLKRGEWKPTVRAAIAEPVVPTVVAAPQSVVVADPASTQPLPEPFRAQPAPVRQSTFRRGVAIAAGVLVVLAGLAFSPRARREVASLVGSNTSSQVVVSVFENRTGSKDLDPLGLFAADVVVRALGNANFVVVDAQTAAGVTKWLASSTPPSGTQRDRAAALAAETGAGIVVTGNYYRQGDTVQFEASIIDASTAVRLHNVGPVRGPLSKADTLVADLANRVAASMTASSDSTPGGATARLIAPSSIEAYEHAARGWEMFFARPWDTSAVFAELNSAIAIDSNYPSPLLMRGYILDVKGQWVELAQLVERLKKRRASMSRVEREAIALFEADLHGDLLGRLRVARELSRLNPGSADMALLVAISASYINRAAEAHQALVSTRVDRGIDQVSPMYWAWRAASEHALGNFTDEFASAGKELQSFPSSATAPLAFTRAYAARGNMSALNALLAKAGFAPGTATPDAIALALLGGRELRAHGFAKEASALFARIAAIPPRQGASNADLAQHALSLYEAGDYRNAQMLFARLAASDSLNMEWVGRLGAAASRAGDAATALTIQNRLANWSQPFSLGVPTYWRAHLAALAGQRAEVVSLLHQAITEGYRPMDLGTITLHEDGDFAALWKDAAFLEFVRPRDGPAALP